MKRLRDPGTAREAMRARDLTTREMGLLCECDERTVRFMLAGRAINPRLARRVARVLRRKVDDLFAAAESTTEQADDDCQAVPA